MTERSGHRVSFGAGVRDTEAAAGTGANGGSAPGGAAAARHAYDPKSKARTWWLRRALGAVREVGMAKLVSGGISIFLLLSVFSVRFIWHDRQLHSSVRLAPCMSASSLSGPRCTEGAGAWLAAALYS